MTDNSLNNKLNIYFNKNPTLDKNMIINSLELLIKGRNLDDTKFNILKKTGFFDIVYQIKSSNDEEVNLFKIRSKITKLFNIMVFKGDLDNCITKYDYDKIFNKNNIKIEDKNIQINFEEFNNLITTKIFKICENRISKQKGKFHHSEEILKYLDEIILDINNSNKITQDDIDEKNNYLKETSDKQIHDILEELNIDNNIIDTIDVNNKESIDLIKSFYQESETNNIKYNDSDVKTDDKSDEIDDLKGKFNVIFDNYNSSSKSINSLVDNSKKLEGNIINIVSRIKKLEDVNLDTKNKVSTLVNEKNNKSKIEYEYIFKDIENALKNFKNDLNLLDNNNNTNSKELDILKSRLSIIDSDLSKHKECVVNSFEIIEERLTQLFKSMIIVNNNIKHCYSNTEKMYSEIAKKIR
jgi:hypothetical protein